MVLMFFLLDIGRSRLRNRKSVLMATSTAHFTTVIRDCNQESTKTRVYSSIPTGVPRDYRPCWRWRRRRREKRVHKQYTVAPMPAATKKGVRNPNQVMGASR